ncbi:MAG: DNA replication/repair protein RecF [Actinomycetota bacterium]|nr:DNA replication/repair protein RecF [Actinomycetota bacterium]
MWIKRLGLEDFRNYDREAVDFAPGLNLIRGRNAQGKTNLLEAVHCLSGLGSPRSHDSALVRDGTERALVHAELERGARPLRIDVEIRPGRGTKALVNRTPIPRTRSLTEFVVTVFFGPDELSLVKGSPDGRRRFLDELGIKLRPAREGTRREWDRVLKQRNALLKSARRGSLDPSMRATLEVWDDALCRTGAAVAAARLHALADLIPYASKRFEEVAGGGRLDLSYVSSWLESEETAAALVDPSTISELSLAEHLRSKLEASRRQELERGMSLVGPQRDDVLVRLASAGDEGAGLLEARTFASQGDQRTSALALKLAEHDLLRETLGEEPILLLDDVFSELDPQRRSWLGDAVGHLAQTLVTSATATDSDSAKAAHVIEVDAGRVMSV